MSSQDQFKLNAIDRFMLMHDKCMRKHTGRGNVCVLSFALAGAHAHSELEGLVKQRPVFSTVSNLRLRGSLFTGYSWKPVENEILNLPRVKLNEKLLDAYVSKLDINPEKDAPIALQYVESKDGQNYLLFLWHHSLMDAHGAENFISMLFDPSMEHASLFKPDSKKRERFSLQKLKEKFAVLLEVKNHIFKQAREPVLYLKKHQSNSCRYRHVQFSVAETSVIEQRARDLNVELYKSSYYLYSVARSFKEIFDNSQSDSSYFIPMPRDLRRNFKSTSILGNQIGVIFMRANAKALEEINSGLDSIIKSAQAGIVFGLHRKCNHFFNAIKYLPDFLYKRLIDAPTKGRQASFYFSDTGESLSKFRNLLNQEIDEVRHFPPHFFPPGFSTIFSKFGNQLTVALVYSDAQNFNGEIDRFEISLRQTLIGP